MVNTPFPQDFELLLEFLIVCVVPQVIGVLPLLIKPWRVMLLSLFIGPLLAAIASLFIGIAWIHYQVTQIHAESGEYPCGTFVGVLFMVILAASVFHLLVAIPIQYFVRRALINKDGRSA